MLRNFSKLVRSTVKYSNMFSTLVLAEHNDVELSLTTKSAIKAAE